MKNYDDHLIIQDGSSAAENASTIHNTSRTEAIWLRVTSQGAGTENETSDPSVSGLDSLKALYAGYDPIIYRKKAVEEIAKALEEIGDKEIRDEKRKSVLNRLDVISRLGSVRRVFKIFLGDKPSQQDLDFVDDIIRHFWDAHNQVKNTYEDFLEFWQAKSGFSFQYVNPRDGLQNFPLNKIGDTLMPEYIWSLLSGDPSKMHEGFMDRLKDERNSQEVEINFDSAPGTVTVSFSLINMLGKDSVISKMMLGNNETENRIGATDTFINMYLPVNKKEKDILASAYKENPEKIVKIIIESLRKSSGTVGLGHGFGASKDVWNSMIGELLRGINHDGDEEDSLDSRFGMEGRVIGLSLSTKGADFTTLDGENLQKEQQSGRMDRAAIQIVESLRVMGLAGWGRVKPLLWVGHSMGGQEALWLPVFADNSWNIKIISVTPVVDKSREFLQILYGKVGDAISEFGAKLTELVLSDSSILSDQAQSWAAWVGQRIHIVRSITQNLIIPKGLSAESADYKRLVSVVNTHMEQFKNLPFMRGVFKHLRDNDYLNDDWLKRIFSMFGDNIEAIYMGGEDEILKPLSGSSKLVGTGWEQKIKIFPKLPHYLTHMDQGIQSLIKDGKKILADRLPFNFGYGASS